MVNLLDGLTPETPKSIKTYLQGLGIKAIDYPSANEPDDAADDRTEMLKAGDQNADIVSTVLDLTGRQASTRVEIPIYQSQKTDFNLIVKADFLLNIGGRDSIIDLTGLGPEIVSLLDEHQFLVLTLSDVRDPSLALTKTLEFTGIPFQPGPHAFLATVREEKRNIRLTIPGTIFRDKDGKSVFATPLSLPDQIAGFLSFRGYRILSLAGRQQNEP